jgi:hypothetical protein
MTLVDKDYNKLIGVIQSANNYEIQLFLAKVTGQFKHGNEKLIRINKNLILSRNEESIFDAKKVYLQKQNDYCLGLSIQIQAC